MFAELGRENLYLNLEKFLILGYLRFLLDGLFNLFRILNRRLIGLCFLTSPFGLWFCFLWIDGFIHLIIHSHLHCFNLNCYFFYNFLYLLFFSITICLLNYSYLLNNFHLERINLVMINAIIIFLFLNFSLKPSLKIELIKLSVKATTGTSIRTWHLFLT